MSFWISLYNSKGVLFAWVRLHNSIVSVSISFVTVCCEKRIFQIIPCIYGIWFIFASPWSLIEWYQPNILKPINIVNIIKMIYQFLCNWRKLRKELYLPLEVWDLLPILVFEPYLNDLDWVLVSQDEGCLDSNSPLTLSQSPPKLGVNWIPAWKLILKFKS